MTKMRRRTSTLSLIATLSLASGCEMGIRGIASRAPLSALDQPPATLTLSNPFPTPLNQSTPLTSVPISGTCDPAEAGMPVNITGAVTASTTCTSAGTWSTSVNLSTVPEGTVNLTATLVDRAGDAHPVSISFLKDTQPPSANSIVVNGGATYTSAATVTLTLGSTGASEMYVTSASGCGSGGTWEPYATTKSAWTHNGSNSTAQVYAKFRDGNLNESACVSDSIIHDNTLPTTPTALTLGSVPASLSTTPTLSWTASTDASGIGSYSVQLHLASDDSVVQSWTTLASGSSLSGLSLTAGSSYYLKVRATDNAANVGAAAQSASWTATAAPVCSGVMVGGYCWFLSPNDSTSCDTVCASKGGVHTATIFYAGSGGTGAQCTSVLTALGSSGSTSYDQPSAIGCNLSGSSYFDRGIQRTRSDLANGLGDGQPACACQDGSNPAPTPAEITSLTVLGKSSQAVTLQWNRGGTGNSGFRVAYQTGATAPANCSSAQLTESAVDAGYTQAGVARYTVEGLSANTQYSFRLCASDAQSTPVLSSGLTVTATTDPYNTTLALNAPVLRSSSSGAANGSTIQYAHTVASGSNRLLVVSISGWYQMPTVSSMTYAGQSLIRQGGVNGSFQNTDVWYLVNPPVGVANVTIQMSSSFAQTMPSVAMSFDGVNQTTPVSNFYSGDETGGRWMDQYYGGSAEDHLIVGMGSWYYGTPGYSANITPALDQSSVLAHAFGFTSRGETSVHLRWTDRTWWSAYVLRLNPL